MLYKSSYMLRRYYKQTCQIIINPNLLSNNTSLFCNVKSSSIRQTPIAFDLLIKKLQAQIQYSIQLQKSLNQDSNAFINKSDKEKMRIQLSKLSKSNEIYDRIKGYQQNIKLVEEMIKECGDSGEKLLLEEQKVNNKIQLEEAKQAAWQLLIPPIPYENSQDIIIQLRPGAGGAQSSIFVKDLSQMYEFFCGMQGWKSNIVNSVRQTGVSKGYKALDLKIQGEGALKVFKSEAGVHKVIRIPQTESKGRVHSSTISVVVMPVVPFAFEVDPKDIKYQYTKSSGPGGQAVNKIQSACRATHIPTGLAVFSQQFKSQQMNRRRATQILRQKLFEMQYKKSVQQQQQRRKSQVTTLERSQKIRTYNFPQDRITDHRTGLTKFGIKAMMSGQLLEQFYQAYNANLKKQQIETLLQELHREAGINI